MSSVTVVGPICLTMGKRITSTSSTNVNTYHTHYVSAIQFATAKSIPVTIRVYSPAQDIVRPDHTIAFVIGALNAPAGETAFIDANQRFTCFPGNPRMEGYEKTVLDMPFLHVYAIGQVLNQADLLDDGLSRSFNIAVSEWVLDGVKHFTLNCKIDGKSPRWKNTRAPNVNHFVKVEGDFTHVVKPSKILGITISQLTFLHGGSSDQSGNPSTSDSSSKKRKFDPAFSTASSPSPEIPTEDATVHHIQDSLMNSPPLESIEPVTTPVFTLPCTSSVGAGPSPKKRGKRKATDLNV